MHEAMCTLGPSLPIESPPTSAKTIELNLASSVRMER